MFTFSNGGHGYATGYWVVYINDEIQRELSQININSYSHHFDMKHIYASKIPGPINMKV